METRQIMQVRIWKLILNPMRDRTEAMNLVAISYDRQKLIDWYESQKAPEPYTDEEKSGSDYRDWHKSFLKGGPLEWYNPLDNFGVNYWGHGISDEWVEQELANRNTSNYILIN